MTSACRIQQIRAELVELRWNDGQFCVTADHSVLVKACGDSPWQAKQARNVRPDEDQLLIVPAPVPAAIASSDLCLVVVTERRVYEAVQDVIEVEMAYPANKLLASSTCSDGPFVTVLGKQPPKSCFGEINVMQISRFPAVLPEVFRQSECLQACA